MKVRTFFSSNERHGAHGQGRGIRDAKAQGNQRGRVALYNNLSISPWFYRRNLQLLHDRYNLGAPLKACRLTDLQQWNKQIIGEDTVRVICVFAAR